MLMYMYENICRQKPPTMMALMMASHKLTMLRTRCNFLWFQGSLHTHEVIDTKDWMLMLNSLRCLKSRWVLVPRHWSLNSCQV